MDIMGDLKKLLVFGVILETKSRSVSSPNIGQVHEFNLIEPGKAEQSTLYMDQRYFSETCNN